MSRLIREHAKGKIEETVYKSLLWGLSQLIQYWRLEKDIEIEARLSALEELIHE